MYSHLPPVEDFPSKYNLLGFFGAGGLITVVTHRDEMLLLAYSVLDDSFFEVSNYPNIHDQTLDVYKNTRRASQLWVCP